MAMTEKKVLKDEPAISPEFHTEKLKKTVQERVARVIMTETSKQSQLTPFSSFKLTESSPEVAQATIKKISARPKQLKVISLSKIKFVKKDPKPMT